MHDCRETSFINDLDHGIRRDAAVAHIILLSIYSYYYLCGKTLKGRRQRRRPLDILYTPPPHASSFLLYRHTHTHSSISTKSSYDKRLCVRVCCPPSCFYRVVFIALASPAVNVYAKNSSETTPRPISRGRDL